MADRPATSAPPDDGTAVLDGPIRLIAVLAVILVALMGVRLLGDAAGGSGGVTLPGGAATGSDAATSVPSAPGASVDPASLLVTPTPAADLDLTGPNGLPVSLAAMRGAPVLVFFGYTHCPDVCPATIGTVGLAIDAFGQGARAIFVSIDPERDTVPWLAEFVRFMPKGFTAVTGRPDEIRATADDWSVRYAKAESENPNDPNDYGMSHTADVFLVDSDGQLRARFPFGTEAETMTAVMGTVESTAAEPSSEASASPAPSVEPSIGIDDLRPRVISSSVWAGGSSPLIVGLFDRTGTRLDDLSLSVTAQVLDGDGRPVGASVPVRAVQPLGVPEVSFVADIDLPTAGQWTVRLEATGTDGTIRHGSLDVTALDPGGSAPLGKPAPTVRTPVAADFDGDLTWVTTDPAPDPRLSQTSTTDALAAGTPFVLVVDSVQFKVTPVCGKAVVLARRLVDRWRDVPFIHLEPYRYTVITTEPVLEGSLQDPRLTAPAEAWGVGAEPWGVRSMPWIFIVDGDGIVRAKYQGVVGSADVDVILSALTQAP